VSSLGLGLGLGLGRGQAGGGADVGDPFWDDVTLLLLMEGANGSTTFTDSSSAGTPVVVDGAATISTAQFFQGASSCLNGSPGGLQVQAANAAAYDFGAGDFTMEMYWRYTSGGADRHLFDCWSDRFLLRASGGNLQFYTNFAAPLMNYPFTLVANDWRHTAVCRNGNSWGLWYNGVSLGSTTNAGTIASTAAALRMSPSNSNVAPGYMDCIRITKAARYTPGVDFTPPTEFPTF
jgi:hypothetical protein